jgi:hypothetical protein
MSDMIPLTETELDLVAGGYQNIYISASQSNSSSVSQTATAYNYGAVTASGGGYDSTTVAVGALASNTALVYQSNAISARNSFHY